jgi:hypothetical protein
MLYVGFVITILEAIRLLKLDESLVKSFYDTKPIQEYLNQKQTRLVFEYIDKGACLFGVPVDTENGYTKFPYTTIEDTVQSILIAKIAFLRYIKHLDMDTNEVNLTWIEEEEILVENPEPYVISL